MTAERVVVVGDAHLGAEDTVAEAGFRAFLAAVPSLGSRLLLAGDIFDFWFEYRSVVPRRHVRTAAAIAAVREAGLQVEMLGGNHDRWGGRFWTEDLGISFHPSGTDLELAGRRAWVHHGDGISDPTWTARALQAVLRSGVTVALFRSLHPSIGFALAERLADHLEGEHKNAAIMDRAAEIQADVARGVFARRPELQLIVMGHTHRQRCLELAPGQTYLNAGQWMFERQYAVVSPESIWVGRWPDRPEGGR